MNGYGLCSRCGQRTIERLSTHSFCWECNFHPDEEEIDQWRNLEFRNSKISNQRLREDERDTFGYGLPRNHGYGISDYEPKE
jgi:hypothetical protein